MVEIFDPAIVVADDRNGKETVSKVHGGNSAPKLITMEGYLNAVQM